MFDTCAKCGSNEEKEVVNYYKPESNIMDLGHWHYICNQCGMHNLKWDCDEKRLKEAYENHKDYC